MEICGPCQISAIIYFSGGNEPDLRKRTAQRVNRQRPEALQHEAAAERLVEAAQRACTLRKAQRKATSNEASPPVTAVVRPQDSANLADLCEEVSRQLAGNQPF